MPLMLKARNRPYWIKLNVIPECCIEMSQYSKSLMILKSLWNVFEFQWNKHCQGSPYDLSFFLHYKIKHFMLAAKWDAMV